MCIRDRSLAGFEEIKTTDVLDNSIEENILNNKEFTYEDIFLNDVVFELYAKEDIVTQDNQGTNWFDAGEKVAIITTGKGAEFTKDCNGICSYTVDKETGNVTMNLPLGKYELKEINTIYGYVLPAVSYTHLRAHETRHDLVCRLLLEKKKKHLSLIHI